MRHNWILPALIIAFNICYMEWGQGQSATVFQTMLEIFGKPEGFAAAFSHPIILAGLAGQILLLTAFFRRPVSRKLAWAGIIVLAPVVILVLIAGALSQNLLILGSVLPFLVLCWWWYRSGKAEGNVQ